MMAVIIVTIECISVFFYQHNTHAGLKNNLIETKALRFLEVQYTSNQHVQTCLSDGPVKCPTDQQEDVLTIYFTLDNLPKQKQYHGLRFRLIDSLMSMRREKKWGYLDKGPLDADDTAFALLVLHKEKILKHITPLLTFYNKQDDAFVTFQSRHLGDLKFKKHLVRQINRTPEGFLDNYMYHPEVNLNIYRLLKRFGEKRYINPALVKEIQNEDGSWSSFFYPSRYYGCWLASDFLSGQIEYKDQLNKTLMFILKTQNSDGSWGNGDSLDTALALDSLLQIGYRGPELMTGYYFLKDKQHADGSWRTKQAIWQYMAFIPNKERTETSKWTSFDSSGVITTSLALRVMNKFDL